ncbi:MAG: hypothetical protein DMF80_17970 [Acidobacteria bacterium]|nr:MAG: hypothetical protein DMF80_17970 [Acidobacteriota bacterium]
MRLVAAAVAVSLVAAAADRAESCGDKFLRVGRGARYQRGYAAIRAACILIYADPRSPLAGALRELEPALKRAGHSPRVVESPGAVGPALVTGHYNVVIAPVEDVGLVQAQAQGLAARFDVLPVLHRPSASARTAAEHDYHCVAEAPGRKGDVLASIDDVMERLAKGGQNRKER